MWMNRTVCLDCSFGMRISGGAWELKWGDDAHAPAPSLLKNSIVPSRSSIHFSSDEPCPARN